MGESGPEAIMPLKRLPSGNLGVEASTSTGQKLTAVTVNNYSGADVSTKETQGVDGRQLEITIAALMNKTVAAGKLDKVLQARNGGFFQGIRS